MHDMTAANLRSAYGGDPNVARLFIAIAHAEWVHARNHFHALRDDAGAHLVAAGGGFGLGTTSQNLQGAIEGELFEVDEMYATYIQTARFQAEQQAQRTFHFACEAEKLHAQMYQKAKDAVDAGKDVDLGPVQVCEQCGHTLEGEAPDKCPVCGVGKNRFKTFA